MNQNLNKKLKKNNGFTGQDIIIATFIIIIFLSTFTTIMVNLSNTSAEISKVKRVTDMVTKMADKFDAITYDDIAVTNEKDVKDLFSDINLYNNMKATYEVTETSDKTQKKIKLKVTYPDVAPVEITIGKKKVVQPGEGDGTGTGSGTGSTTNKIVTINKNPQYPFNRPTRNVTESSNGYEYGDGKAIIPIKFLWTNVTSNNKTGSWVITTEDDIGWYSLEENIWPTFVYNATERNRTAQGYTNSQSYTKLKYNPFDEEADGREENKWAFIWVPRILKENSNYAYAYEDTNNKIAFNNKSYYQYTLARLNVWDNSLHTGFGDYKYNRGALIARNSQSKDYDTTADGWKIIINNLPDEVKTKIQKIHMHINDQ